MRTKVLPALEVIPECYTSSHNTREKYLCRHHAGLTLLNNQGVTESKIGGAKGIVLAFALVLNGEG
jgi:hypothetical protein